MVKQKIIYMTQPEMQLICIPELYHMHMYMLQNEMNDMPNYLIKHTKPNQSIMIKLLINSLANTSLLPHSSGHQVAG